MRRSDRRQVYDELLAVIRRVRRRWRLRVLLRGLAITGAAALVALLAAGAAVESLEPSARGVLWLRLAVGVGVALTALLALVRPLLRRVGDETIALYLEEHEPSLEAAVLSALDTGTARQEEGAAASPPISDALLLRTLETAIRRCHAIDDGRWIERGALARVGAALAAVLVTGALVGFLGPLSARRGAASLFGSPPAAAAAGARAIVVSPGSATVSRGADASITARLEGFDASLVELGVRSAGDSAFDRLPMAGEDGRFGYLLFDLDMDTDYFVEAAGVRSDIFTLTVAELPYVDRLDLELVYPAYTGLPARAVEDGGDVAAVRGTVVRVTATPTLPVSGGGIVVDGAGPRPLTVDSATGVLTGEFRIRSDGFYHIVLDGPSGETLEASPRYVIDALSDGEPLVAFEEPGRDERATAIDELYVEARAEDDYGIGGLTLHFAINGGEEQTVGLYGGRGALKEVTAGHTFYLEEYGLEPGDLIAYYATAVDNDDVAGGKRASSDIYFVQVRPFSREYSAAESRGLPMEGQQQGADGDLTERQRQIIAGTFNLVRDSASYPASERAENLNTLALAQERLRDDARTLARQMVARRVTADTAFHRIAEILPRAAEEMDRAVSRLRDGEASAALPPEQRALQQLQRAEAIFREVQVTLGQQPGGGPAGGSAQSEDLADLFELEMDKLEDQYETVNRGGGARDSASAAVDETAERLEELARRQQQEVERQRRETARDRGTAGGAAQRRLADQVEEEARRLERLSREQRRPELEEAAGRLRDAAASMRRSAADGRGGDRAVEGLREARRLLERSREEALRRRAREVGRDAERLAREQEQIRRQVEELAENASDTDRGERERRLQVRKQLQGDEVEALERELREMAGDASATDQAETARRLRDAAAAISETRLKEKIDFSRQLVRGGAPDEYVRELEGQIQEDLEELRDRLAGLETTLQEPGDGGEAAARALEEAGDLAQGLESMRQRAAEARERASGSPRGGGGFAPGPARQSRSEARERLEDARELRNRLRGQGVETDELDALIGGLQELTGEGPYTDADEVARLQAALADRAKRMELVLRMQLAGEEQLRLFLSGDAAVAPEYRELVEEYYRSLSRERDRP